MALDLHISVDVEADGPIPGPYSMTSFGMAACSTYDGTTFTRLTSGLHTDYRELKPISDKYDPAAAAVAGLDRDHLIRHGEDPRTAMAANAAWIRKTAQAHDARPVFVGYPLAFDWLFVYWYHVNFADTAPFGHSGHLDTKTMYAVKAASTLGKSTKRSMSKRLMSNRPHTHNALDDAIEQGDLFCNVWEWDGAR